MATSGSDIGTLHNTYTVMNNYGIILPDEDRLDSSRSPSTFLFPPAVGRSNDSCRDSDDNRSNSSSAEPSPISKVERSSSAPNVSNTIFPTDGPLPEYLVRNQKKDVRTQGMVQLDELFQVPPSSPSKTSRSVSSSPTAVRQPRARAQSADDSASKKIKNTNVAKEKEAIEDWEIPAKDIMLTKKHIGQGSFGTVYRGYWHGPVAVKTLNVKNPSMEQIHAFRNEVALLRKTR